MDETVTILDKETAVEAVSRLGVGDLRYLNRLIVERLKLMRQARTLDAMSRFSVGDLVSFETREGQKFTGTVKRLNRKTVSVAVKGDTARWWNVSPTVLTVEKRLWQEELDL